MVAIAIIGGILAVGIGAAVSVYYHPQIIIGGIQKMLYRNGKPINSFDPFAPAMRRVKENGQLYVTEIRYGTDYPNSYLDITYPNEDTSVCRPTVVYFHGGGFFGGNGCGCGCGGNDSCSWLIWILLISCFCGNNGNSWGCGC